MDLTVDFFQVGDYSGLCGYAVDGYKEVQGWGEAPTIEGFRITVEGFRIAEFQNHYTIGPTFRIIIPLDLLSVRLCQLLIFVNCITILIYWHYVNYLEISSL